MPAHFRYHDVVNENIDLQIVRLSEFQRFCAIAGSAQNLYLQEEFSTNRYSAQIQFRYQVFQIFCVISLKERRSWSVNSNPGFPNWRFATLLPELPDSGAGFLPFALVR